MTPLACLLASALVRVRPPRLGLPRVFIDLRQVGRLVALEAPAASLFLHGDLPPLQLLLHLLESVTN